MKRRIPEPEYIHLPRSAGGDVGIILQKFGGSVMFYGVLAAIIATQLTVAVGAYDPHFGTSLFGAIYLPTGLVWLFTLSKVPSLHAALLVDAILHTVLLSIVVWYASKTTAKMASVETHERGSGRWSDLDDLARTAEGNSKGLIGSDEGVFVGSVTVDGVHEQFLLDDSPKHVAIFSPSRGGKGQTLILNTLLTLGSRSVIPRRAPPQAWSPAIHDLALAEEESGLPAQPPFASTEPREPQAV